MNHPINEYLKHYVAACNTRASAALGELALVIPRCRTNQFSRSFLPAAVRLWNVLPSGLFSDGTLGCKLVPYEGLAGFLKSLLLYFLLLCSLLGIMVLGQFWFIEVFIYLILGTKYLLIIITNHT